MPLSPFRGHRFPPDVIRQAVWLYPRFTLSFRDVEDLLAERGLDISYETIRRWVLKFGPVFARDLPASKTAPERDLASRRDGDPDWRRAALALASRRQ
ncbi:transposase-like protein [Hansschlegelia beijingensis]|uniref:Transposase-like protein n=1 Tax=Hansschlegelia beijingensis TaxID=1133344 RepID=A0A7W6GGI7_9HYPH|nr:transposase-like protein [Hansschlegelia beijingensis]